MAIMASNRLSTTIVDTQHDRSNNHTMLPDFEKAIVNQVVEDMEETAALELEHLEAMKYTQTQAELRIEKDHNHFKKREEQLKAVVKGMKEQDTVNRENAKVLQWYLIGAVEKCKQFLIRINTLERELIATKRFQSKKMPPPLLQDTTIGHTSQHEVVEELHHTIKAVQDDVIDHFHKGEQNVKAKEVLEEEAKVFEDLRRQVKVANDRLIQAQTDVANEVAEVATLTQQLEAERTRTAEQWRRAEDAEAKLFKVELELDEAKLFKVGFKLDPEMKMAQDQKQNSTIDICISKSNAIQIVGLRAFASAVAAERAITSLRQELKVFLMAGMVRKDIEFAKMIQQIIPDLSPLHRGKNTSPRNRSAVLEEHVEATDITISSQLQQQFSSEKHSKLLHCVLIEAGQEPTSSLAITTPVSGGVHSAENDGFQADAEFQDDALNRDHPQNDEEGTQRHGTSSLHSFFLEEKTKAQQTGGLQSPRTFNKLVSTRTNSILPSPSQQQKCHDDLKGDSAFRDASSSTDNDESTDGNMAKTLTADQLHHHTVGWSWEKEFTEVNALDDINILPHLLQSLRIRIAEEVYTIIEQLYRITGSDVVELHGSVLRTPVTAVEKLAFNCAISDASHGSLKWLLVIFLQTYESIQSLLREKEFGKARNRRCKAKKDSEAAPLPIDLSDNKMVTSVINKTKSNLRYDYIERLKMGPHATPANRSHAVHVLRNRLISLIEDCMDVWMQRRRGFLPRDKVTPVWLRGLEKQRDFFSSKNLKHTCRGEARKFLECKLCKRLCSGMDGVVHIVTREAKRRISAFAASSSLGGSAFLSTGMGGRPLWSALIGSGARFADAEWDIDTSCLEKDMWKLALLVRKGSSSTMKLNRSDGHRKSVDRRY